jgi:hypothetical protein
LRAADRAGKVCGVGIRDAIVKFGAELARLGVQSDATVEVLVDAETLSRAICEAVALAEYSNAAETTEPARASSSVEYRTPGPTVVVRLRVDTESVWIGV